VDYLDSEVHQSIGKFSMTEVSRIPYGQELLAIIWYRIFCLRVCYPKI